MKVLHGRSAAVVAGAAILVASGAAGGATAASLITGADIKDHSIGAADLKSDSVRSGKVLDGSLALRDITPYAKSQLKGEKGEQGERGRSCVEELGLDLCKGPKGDTGEAGAIGPKGDAGPQGPPGLSHLEADGPYPGATDLGKLGANGSEGDNSDAMVPADGQRHSVWVQCATGKVALGGGFRLAADASQAAAQAIDVLASEPTQVKNGKTLYDDPSVYQPIAGDLAGSILPTGWLVEVVNNGDSAQIVRPWVVCAEIAGSQSEAGSGN